MEKTTPTTKKGVVNPKVETTKTIGNQLTTSANTIVDEIKEGSKEINGIVKKVVNQITDKVELTEGVDKIKDFVKVINTQVKETATEILSEMKDTANDISSVATKSAKDISTKMTSDLNEGVENVKAIVKNVEARVNENVIEMKKNTVKLANEVVENLKINDRLTALKGAVKNANKVALSNTIELIEGIEENGTQWQKVGEKAIKSGLKLVENNTEMMLSTLEAVKTHFGKATNRFKKLVQY